MTATIHPILSVVKDHSDGRTYIMCGHDVALCRVEVTAGLTVLVYWLPGETEVFNNIDTLKIHLKEFRKEILESYGIPTTQIPKSNNKPHTKK